MVLSRNSVDVVRNENGEIVENSNALNNDTDQTFHVDDIKESPNIVKNAQADDNATKTAGEQIKHFLEVPYSFEQAPGRLFTFPRFWVAAYSTVGAYSRKGPNNHFEFASNSQVQKISIVSKISI